MKTIKNIATIIFLNFLALIVSILVLSIAHFIIGVIVAKIDGINVPLVEGFFYSLKCNAKFVIDGLVAASVIYSGHKLLKSELNAVKD